MTLYLKQRLGSFGEATRCCVEGQPQFAVPSHFGLLVKMTGKSLPLP